MYAHNISQLRKVVSTKTRFLKYADWSTLYLRFILKKVNRGHLRGQNCEKLFFIQKQNKMLQKMSKEKDKSKINLQKVIKELFRLAW